MRGGTGIQRSTVTLLSYRQLYGLSTRRMLEDIFMSTTATIARAYGKSHSLLRGRALLELGTIK